MQAAQFEEPRRRHLPAWRLTVTPSGIGRATLCKYFPNVESILAVWHERHVASHLRSWPVLIGSVIGSLVV
jgi:hypothetical protein